MLQGYNDVIYEIILPMERVYEEILGDGEPSKLRHGRLNESGENDQRVYYNRKVINTRNGKKLFTPKIVISFKAYTDTDSILQVEIFDYDMKCLIKKFKIQSKNNDFSIVDMKSLAYEIIDLLKSSVENRTIELIKMIRNKETLKFDEVAQ